MRGAVVFMLAALAFGAQAAAQTLPTPPPPLVHIDAVVTDAKGRVVKDLKADDFSVVEDGAIKSVDSIKFVSADGRTSTDGEVIPVVSRDDERLEASRDGARLFAIFLDEYHVSQGEEADRARDAVSRFIENDLGPRDLAVVVKPLDSIITFRMTHDKAELLKVVAGFEGRSGDQAPRNDFERNYIEAAPARADAVRAQIVTSALDALVNHLGTLQPGRKTLIVVSDGFARPGRRFDGLPTVESTARDANRRGVSVYAIDPRALAGEPARADAPEHQVLRVLSGETDGRLAFAAAEVEPALAASASDASAYYLVTFVPAHPTELRTFHEVTVRVKRPGAQLHARRGYWDASPEDLLREIDIKRAANPTPLFQPMRHASPLIRPWFGVARAPAAADGTAANGLMQVNFVWEAVPPVPGDRSRQEPADLVIVRATRQTDGTLVFTGQVRAQNETPGPATELPSEAQFLAPPGRLLLELEIQDADRNVLDTDVRDVIVGGLTGPVEFGTPAVFRAASARDFRAIENEPDAVPASTRDFTRADHVLIRLPVYGESVVVTATLTNQAGVAMRQLPAVQRTGHVYETDLNLAGFATGDYAIKIAARSQEGDAAENVVFSVVP
ncbi:MAG TPA: VWA domain-containing protein [Vicinamibacterales bacterium]|jgi:VWFA-related protein|nr:VWA domain-containing protein [Vicinamibacterales bacterium]